jgi:hypothetical protein
MDDDRSDGLEDRAGGGDVGLRAADHDGQGASMAPGSPPDTGASIARWLAASAIRTDTSGLMVLASMRSVPGLADSRMPRLPRTTASTSGGSGSMVWTTSASRAASVTAASPRPPWCASRSIFDGLRL